MKLIVLSATALFMTAGSVTSDRPDAGREATKQSLISTNEKTDTMQQSIYTCLWFDGQAKAAAEFYCSVFKNSTITEENAMVVTFDLNGRKFMGLNGGPQFKFNEAISFVVDCANQEEIDYYWEKLTADGGEESMCGWLKDKFGVSWQIVPSILPKLLRDPAKAPKVVEAYMKMKKFDIATLEKAAQ